ncbi:MBL fold metallo-hydrolase [Rickettsia hoogstraalii]|uniref:MBL fold metallo-hydrolase n=1 Tax=Rickettsia hoogstraalii TaxID=467174 RepID=UPI000694A31B|nr:MBL fold metallo-hydrolase [Rickettsia hoogstraalii]
MFFNIDPNIKPKTLLDILKWKITSKRPKWPTTLPLTSTDIPPQKITDNETIRISYIGHVTFLIQIDGLNILTDPVWSERVSPFTFAGPKRVVKPGINIIDLPKIDIIVISHNHYDHLDIRTIKDLWLRDKPKIITPLTNDVIIKKHIPNAEIITLGWGESYKEQEIQLNSESFRQDEFKSKPEERTEVREQRLGSKNSLVSSFLNDAVEFYLEPAQHWSARGIFDKNKALWGTFIIKTKIGDICFIGDSGYNDTLFKEIGKKHNILISLIPIGAYEPRWFMKPVHMNPEEAVFTHLDLNSKYSIASHFDVFQLADEAFNAAPLELRQAMKKHNIDENKFIIPEIGKFFLFDEAI